MLKKLKNLNTGKTNVKVLATLLAIILTFTNFVLLGSYIGNSLVSYALEINLEEQNDETNNDHVKFDVYLDKTNRDVNQTNKDINAKDLMLYISVSVKNGGYLSDGKIEFIDSNFELKDNINSGDLKLDTIPSGKSIELCLPIVAKKDNTFNLGLLAMISQIKLTGKYINNDSKEVDIDSTKGVKICWTSEAISEENNPIKLNQEIITNRILKINETNKRVMQIKVTSGLNNNAYPIKTTSITAEAPALNGVYPEEVIVASYGTKATNNKTSIDFAKDDESILKEDKIGVWSYNKTDKIVNIVVNNKADNNKVSWEKSGNDTFIITYIYPETTKTEEVYSKVENKINLYTSNAELTSQKEFTEEVEEISGEMLQLDSTITDTIYKGNMNIGKNTEFTTVWNLGISYAGLTKSILVGNDIQKDYFNDNTEDIADIEYKNTYINKANMLDLFGQDGELYIFNNDDINNAKDSEGIMSKVIVVLNKDTVTNEEGNMVVEYKNGVDRMCILTSTPVKEGILNIINKKEINTQNYNEEKIKEIEKISTYSVANTIDIEYGSSRTSNSLIKEPITTATVEIDKSKLATTQTNEVNFTITLKEDDIKYDLYKNPIIEVELPEFIKLVEINNIKIVNENGLEISSQEIVTNNNKKTIKVNLSGEQTQYNGNTQILINANLLTNKLIPNLTDNILLRCTNGKETVYAKEQTSATDVAVIKTIAEQGILLATTVNNYNINIQESPEITLLKNEKQEEAGLLNASAEATTASIKGTIINNTENDLTNIIVLGKINNENIETKLSSIIATKGTVYYTEDEDITLNSKWNNEYTENATGYKIEFSKLDKTTIETFSYDIDFPANIETNKDMEISYEVYNGETVIESPKVELQTQKEAKLELKVTPTVENGSKVYEGQKLSYNIEVKNVGNSEVKNVRISNPAPEGTSVLENGYSEWEVESLKEGETVTKTAEVTVNNLSNQNETTVENKTTVTANYLSEPLTNTIENEVEKALITAEIKNGYNDDMNNYENGQMAYKTIIRNISNKDLTNIKIVCNIPQGTIFENEDNVRISVIDKIVEGFSSEEETKLENVNIEKVIQDGKVIFTIDKIPATYNTKIYIKLKGDVIEDNQYEKDINYKVEISSDQIEEYVVEKKDVVVKPNITMKQVAKNNTEATRTQFVNEGDILEYTTTITNNTEYNHNIVIDGNIPNEITCKSITYIDSNNEEQKINYSGMKYYLETGVKSNETITIKMIGTVDNIQSEEDITIKNTINCKTKVYDREGFSSTFFANELTNTVEYTIKGIEKEINNKVEPTNPENPENPNNPEQPTDPENPNKNKVYSISGTAWLDENKNGKMDSSEKLLNNIVVKIKDFYTGKHLIDADKKETTATTNDKGEYVFNNLSAGKYILIFDCDVKTYGVTTGEISKAVITTEGGTTSIKTDAIVITNKNISNINIGLVLNPKFDLQLNKYITKVTVKNLDETNVYNYNKSQLAKVEIPAKKVKGSIVIIEYTIDVTNKGEVAGYAKSIVDYISPELKFSSETNTSWYQGTDNNLYCIDIANDEIKPGETKSVKLILTKTMTENNMGLVNNIAEICEDYNEYVLEDTNSKPFNQEQKENDLSSADIIISVKTGSTILYIGIIIIFTLILGTGIYLINKKVILREKI